ncbi:MAG TPA: S-layer homology domain-containing protein, partial [Bacillota bacterium]|nr:S-layer homology domain-containing protein [Bacillota bacterium]
PQAGKKPNMDLDSIYLPFGANYEVTHLHWSLPNGMSAEDREFVPGISYTIRLSLKPKAGYYFPRNLEAKMNGEPSTVVISSSVELEHTFKVEGATPPLVITDDPAYDIPAGVLGTPQISINLIDAVRGGSGLYEIRPKGARSQSFSGEIVTGEEIFNRIECRYLYCCLATTQEFSIVDRITGESGVLEIAIGEIATVGVPATPRTISFAANGGGGLISDFTINDKDAFVLPNKCDFTPPSPGEQFKCWEVGGEEKEPGRPLLEVKSDTLVTALWEPLNATCTLSFDPGEGMLGYSGTMEEKKAATGSVIILPACAYKAPAGKTFDKWEIAGGQYASGSDYTISADVTATALWKDVQHSLVSYLPNGGGGSKEKFQAPLNVPLTLEDNEFIPPAGRKFKCWRIEGVYYSPGSSYTPVYASTSISAIWENDPAAAVTSVTVLPGTTSVGLGQTQTFSASVAGTGVYNSEVTWKVEGGAVAGTTISYTGGVLTVDAAETAAVLTVTATSKTDPTKSGTATVNVSATPIVKHKLTVNGGSGGAEYEQGEIVTITANAPAAGKTFDKWNVETGGAIAFANVNAASTSFTMPANDVEITAIYKDIPVMPPDGGGGGGGGGGTSTYTLSFEVNGGSRIDPVSAPAGKTISLGSYETTREGYDFAGWYGDEELTDALSEVKLTKNITVYAKWSEKAEEMAEPPFGDVGTGDWFYEYVKYVYNKGLMNGTGEDSFSPYLTTTRGMIVTILYNMAGTPEVTGECPFGDVEAGKYYEKPVIWAAEKGIVSGYGSGNFGPEDAISREQMAVILMNYARLMGYDVSKAADLDKFSDADEISSYAKSAMAWANAEGLINGKGNGILDPAGDALRCEVAAILYNFCENVIK